MSTYALGGYRSRRSKARSNRIYTRIVVAISVGLLAGMIFAATRPAVVTDEPIRQYAPRGETSFGFPSTLTDNVRVDPEFVPMKALAGCSWGQPGRDPWKGDNYSAMLAMNVPSRVAAILAKRIASGLNTAIVTVSNKAIEADNGLAFGPWFAMTFGQSLCYGTRANFADERHVERGKLYQEDGYMVFVPDVCGNITRLMPLQESSRNRTLQAPLLVPGLPKEAQPYAPIPFGGRERLRAVNEVPEPATWALVAVALPFILRRKR